MFFNKLSKTFCRGCAGSWFGLAVTCRSQSNVVTLR